MKKTHSENAPARTALVVDDESVVRNVMRRLLERRGWTVLEAESAESALDLLATHPKALDLVLCDLNLPGLSGGALCARIASLRPELASRIVMTSGDPGAAVAELAREKLLCPVLGKPFSLKELERVVQEMALVA
jgi:CheY-like chemotaxis protein